MSWAYEGIACYVSKSNRTDHTPLYRAWNRSDHFYTTSKREYDNLPSNYQKEGIACYIASSRISGHVPFYRLYKASGDDHFYTTSVSEKNNAIIRLGYKNEGIVGYVMPNEDSKHVPLFRAYNPEIIDHFYTTDVKEIDENGPSLSLSELDATLKDQLKNYLKSGYKIYIADSNYFCPTEPVAQDIIDDSKVDQKTYISEIFDCDDFAHLLKTAFIENAYDGGIRSMPYAFGILWGSTPNHALNFLVLGDGKDFFVRIVEPQTGRIHKPSENKLKDIYLAIG